MSTLEVGSSAAALTPEDIGSALRAIVSLPLSSGVNSDGDELPGALTSLTMVLFPGKNCRNNKYKSVSHLHCLASWLSQLAHAVLTTHLQL